MLPQICEQSFCGNNIAIRTENYFHKSTKNCFCENTVNRLFAYNDNSRVVQDINLPKYTYTVVTKLFGNYMYTKYCSTNTRQIFGAQNSDPKKRDVLKICLFLPCFVRRPCTASGHT